MGNEKAVEHRLELGEELEAGSIHDVLADHILMRLAELHDKGK